METFNAKEIENCFDCTKHLCRVCTVEQFALTPDGRGLKDNPPRFSHFMWEDEKRFREFMGPDVDNFAHGPHQADTVALPMIEFQNASNRPHFSEEEARLLYFTHLVHDFHEYRMGDIALPDKTRESDIAELAVNREVVKAALNMTDDDPYLIGSQAIMGDFDGETFLGRAFKAGEYVGYLHTGLRAWAMREHSLLDDDERHQAYELGKAVLTKNTPVLVRYADEFPYVKHLLDNNYEAIRQACDC